MSIINYSYLFNKILLIISGRKLFVSSVLKAIFLVGSPGWENAATSTVEIRTTKLLLPSDVTDIAETGQWEIAHFPQNTHYLSNFLAIMIRIIVLEVLDIYNPTAKLKLRMNSIRNWAKTVSGTALADEMSVDLGSDIGEKTAAVSDNNFQLVHQIFLKLHTSIFKPLISNQVSQFLKLRPRLWAISDQQSKTFANNRIMADIAVRPSAVAKVKGFFWFL